MDRALWRQECRLWNEVQMDTILFHNDHCRKNLFQKTLTFGR